jgi:hypothetical protein
MMDYQPPSKASAHATTASIGTQSDFQEIKTMTILVIILVLLLIGAFPTWPYSRSWGYYPSGGLGLVVLILIILLVMGRI